MSHTKAAAAAKEVMTDLVLKHPPHNLLHGHHRGDEYGSNLFYQFVWVRYRSYPPTDGLRPNTVDVAPRPLVNEILHV